jgi:hypothetical protein
MSVVNGYNFDWSVEGMNEDDEAFGSFPKAYIQSPVETNMDQLNDSHAQAYANEVLFIVDCKGILPEFDYNPGFALRSVLRKALDDLKKLFGTNNSVNNTCDVIFYKSSQVVPVKMNDVMKPGFLRTQWLVVYSQDRLNPLQYAT